jgi:hypothetical protein
MSSTARSPPFAFSRDIVAPQSKSTSIRESYERHSARNVEATTAFSSPSGGSPASSVQSPQDVCGIPIPPCHPAPWPPTPLDSTKSCLPCTSARSYGHDAPTNVRAQSAAASMHSVLMCFVTFYAPLQYHTRICPLYATLGLFVGNC